MITHFKHNLTQRPVCFDEPSGDAVALSQDLDQVDCVECLRRLLKSAGQFGNENRVNRKTTYGKRAR